MRDLTVCQIGNREAGGPLSLSESRRLGIVFDRASMSGRSTGRGGWVTTAERRGGGFAVLDSDGTVRFATDAARHLLNRDELVGMELGVPLTLDGFARADIIGSDGPRTLTITTVEGEWEGEPAFIAVLHDDLDAVAPDTDWISVAGHEMNNPLTVITGYGETLYDHVDTMDVDSIRGAAAGILRQAGRLQRLVARLLTHARSNAGLVDNSPAHVPLSDLGETLRRDFPGDVSVELSSDLHVWADRSHVLLVLENLIENALRYGDPPVVVSAAGNDNGRVCLSVRDHGVGIPGASMERLFEPFERGTGGRQASGVGLGLSIVKKLVEANDGTIAYADAPGGGAQFDVDLPVNRGTRVAGTGLTDGERRREGEPGK